MNYTTMFLSIVDLPVPTNIKQTRRLLGMCGWYRRFIGNSATITASITNCLKKGKFQWTEEAQLAFADLKSVLSNAPLLVNAEYIISHSSSSVTRVLKVLERYFTRKMKRVKNNQ